MHTLARALTIAFVLIFFSLSLDAQERYWVGDGGGSWSNPNSWATISGGPGGAGVPGPNDIAIFDNASFAPVNNLSCVVTEPITCRAVIFNRANNSLVAREPLTVLDSVVVLQGIIEGDITTPVFNSRAQNNTDVDLSNLTLRISATDRDTGFVYLTAVDELQKITFDIPEGQLINTDDASQNGIDTIQWLANGYIEGNHEFNLFDAASGHTVYIENGSQQTINEDLPDKDQCLGSAGISAVLDFEPRANIVTPGFQLIRGYYLRRLRFNPPVEINLESISGGENILQQNGGNNRERDMYWTGNGGDGDWFNPQNWEERNASGTPVNCVPTNADNVFFDENSFSNNSAKIIGRGTARCYNFTYDAPETDITFDLDKLYIGGDVRINNTIANWIGPLVIINGQEELGSPINQPLRTSNTVFENINIRSVQDVILDDDLNLRGELNILGIRDNVTFQTNGNDINTGRFIADNSRMGLDLSESYITIRDSLDGSIENNQFAHPLLIRNTTIVDADQTQWELTSPFTGFEIDMGAPGSIWFSDPDGMAFPFTTQGIDIQTLRFEGNAQLKQDRYTIDSLILTPGNRYQFDSGQDYTFNTYLGSEGTICDPIVITTEAANATANFIMSSAANLNITYTEVSNITASGGNDFITGVGTVDEGGNTGWTFTNNTTAINRFLGEDDTICNSSAQYLVRTNLEADELDSIIYDGNDIRRGADVIDPFIITVNGRTDPRTVIAEAFFSNGCTQFDTVVINFDPAINPFILNAQDNDNILCNGESTSIFGYPRGDADSIRWNTGATTPNIMVDTAGVYRTTIYRGACDLSDEITIESVDLRDFRINGDGEDIVACDNQPITLTSDVDPSVFSTRWSDGSFGQGIEARQTDIYWAEISDGNCSFRDSINVTFQSNFEADLGRDTVLCFGDSITLDPNVGRNSASYLWSTGATTSTITVVNADTISVMVTDGSCQDMDTIVIGTGDIKAFTLASDTTLCQGESISLSVPEDYLGDFSWSTGENTARTITVSDEGSYSLSLTDAGTCTRADTVLITVDDSIPSTSQNISLCTGQTFEANALVSGNTTYDWSTGDSTSSVTLTEEGSYTVTITRGACNASSSYDVDIINTADFNVGSDTLLCEGESIVLESNISGNASYSWSTGSNAPSIEVNNPDTYVVTVVIQQSCEAFDTVQVDFRPQPSIDLGLPRGNDSTICSNELDSLRGTIPNGTNYEWHDGSTNPRFPVDGSGRYAVTATDGVCTVTESVELTVQEVSALSLGDPVQFICEGDSIGLTVEGLSGVRYIWNIPNILFQEPIYYVSTADTISAQLTQGDCTVDDTVIVRVNPLPELNLANDTAICEGTQVRILTENPDYEYQYSWNDVNNTGGNIIVEEENTYRVNALSEDGCESTAAMTLTVNPLPTFDLGGEETFLCEGESKTITATPPRSNIVWNMTGSGNSSFTVREPGTVTATATEMGCSFTDQIEVIEQAKPIVELGPDTVICEDDMITLDAFNEGATYRWSRGQTTPTIAATGSGTYFVTVNINGCENTDDININTKPTPSLVLSSDTTICEGDMHTITSNNPGNWSVEWSTGETADQISVEQEGTYTATAMLNGCSDSQDFQLAVEALPVFDLGIDTAKCEELSLTLSANVPNGTQVVWQDGTQGRFYTVDNPSTYSATATTPNGCQWSDDITISNRECVRFQIAAPNVIAVTDGVLANEDNATFSISTSNVSIISYSLEIYDKWGGRVFASNDINETWNGTSNNMRVAQGVYAYVVELEYLDDFSTAPQRVVETGNVTVIR